MVKIDHAPLIEVGGSARCGRSTVLLASSVTNPTGTGGDEMNGKPDPELYDTVVIGGGQAGLTAGYYLSQQDGPFVILDANERVGDAWRKRWDSLRLFTPATFSGLPGFPFPAPRWSFPTKDELADYLETYAARFRLPVRTGVAVQRLSKAGERFVVSAGERTFRAANVVVATGAHQVPRIPAFAAELDPRIVQLHSSEYRNPSQLQDGAVLVVGAGNSGAEIALELSHGHTCSIAGPKTGEIPVRHGTLPARFGFRVFRFLGHHVLRVDTRLGRKLGSKLVARGDPLIRTRLRDLAAAGVEHMPRVVGVRGGLPELEDGRAVHVTNVVWCTGFRTDFDWIDLPVFDGEGQPLHYRGVVESEPGLSFLGLVFQYSLSSDVLPNRGRDARYLARHIARRRREHPLPAPALAAA
jgi:putative flavoprotein involved in K+ transport